MIAPGKETTRFRLELMAQLREVMPQPVLLEDLLFDLQTVGFKNANLRDCEMAVAALSEESPPLVKVERCPTNREQKQAILTEAGRVHLSDAGY